MARTNFEKLEVYLLAERLADEIWRIVREWDQFAKTTMGQQMVDAADSIGANIAEGTSRGSHADNRRFVRIARGSLYETKHWLRRANCRELLTREQVNKLKPLTEELAPKLNAFLSSISKVMKSNQDTPSAHNAPRSTNH
jgi:four helix bundle protein